MTKWLRFAVQVWELLWALLSQPTELVISVNISITHCTSQSKSRNGSLLTRIMMKDLISNMTFFSQLTKALASLHFSLCSNALDIISDSDLTLSSSTFSHGCKVSFDDSSQLVVTQVLMAGTSSRLVSFAKLLNQHLIFEHYDAVNSSLYIHIFKSLPLYNPFWAW